jgi:hypothetical protein
MDVRDVSGSLRIGDVINLRYHDAESAEESCLAAEGILDEILTAANPPSIKEHAVFQICVRTRVSAAQELHEFESGLRKRRGHEKEHDDAKRRANDLLATLRRVYEQEIEMNKKLMIEQTGAPIHYGDLIQLRHMLTGSLLSCASADVSISEPENFAVTLTEESSQNSWFQIRPAKAHESMSDPIMNNGRVFLTCARDNSEFLHVGMKEFPHPNRLARASAAFHLPGQKMREVNISLDRTEWQMSLFSPCMEPKNQETANPNNIQIGEIVYISNPELKSYLRLGNKKGNKKLMFEKFKKSDEGNARGNAEQIYHASSYFVVQSLRELRSCRNDVLASFDAAASASDDSAAAKHVLLRGSSVKNMNIKGDVSAGELPPDRNTEGGNVAWGEHVILRHLITGKFVRVLQQYRIGDADAKTEEAGEADIDLVLVDLPFANTIQFNPVVSHESAALRVEIAAKMRVCDNRSGSLWSLTAEDPVDGISMVEITNNGAEEENEGDGNIDATPLLLHKVGAQMRLDLFMGLATLPLLRTLRDRIVDMFAESGMHEFSDPSAQSELPTMVHEFSALMHRLRDFVRGKKYVASAPGVDEEDEDLDNGMYSRSRQRLMQEQGILEQLVDILEIVREPLTQMAAQKHKIQHALAEKKFTGLATQVQQAHTNTNTKNNQKNLVQPNCTDTTKKRGMRNMLTRTDALRVARSLFAYPSTSDCSHSLF